jgi:hypothetical protein
MTRLPARPALFAVAVLSLATIPALAQANGRDWQKTYSVSGSAALTIETADSGLEIVRRLQGDSRAGACDARSKPVPDGGAPGW